MEEDKKPKTESYRQLVRLGVHLIETGPGPHRAEGDDRRPDRGPGERDAAGLGGRGANYYAEAAQPCGPELMGATVRPDDPDRN
jgi:hypothetical protein